MSYQQLHAGKVKLNGLAGIRHHLVDRNKVKTNPNIDLSRSNLNYAVEELQLDNLEKRVRQRIKQLNLKRKPRADAVGLEDIVVGASVDFMLQLGAEKREKYFEDALHFFQDRYGKENVMYCQCHMDESNPHIHIGIIPVTVDGRLSARDVFSPLSLEKLQTDFHLAVSQEYGLERGEHHSKTYLEVNQFKARKAKEDLQKFSSDLNSSLLTQENISQINRSVHYVTTGVVFKSEDKSKVELPTKDFFTLQTIAEEGIKASVTVHLLQEQNKQLQLSIQKLHADYDQLSYNFEKFHESTDTYSSIPTQWRKPVDENIEQLKQTFTTFCHDVNRMIVQVFIATNGDFDQTAKIMRKTLLKAGVKNIKNHIAHTLKAAKSQLRKNLAPASSANVQSWKPPKPSETDYSQPCNSQALDFADSDKLVDLRLDSIDWDLINWNLLSEFEKAELKRKKLIREL